MLMKIVILLVYQNSVDFCTVVLHAGYQYPLCTGLPQSLKSVQLKFTHFVIIICDTLTKEGSVPSKLLTSRE